MSRPLFAATFGVFASISLANAALGAETYQCTIEQAPSSVASTTDLSTFFPATIIGNYDAETNPDGTLTRNGLFGGSGNEEIAIDMTPQIAGDINSNPVGSFEMDVDTEALAIAMRNLELDMLAGAPGELDLTLTLSFGSFRTFNPDSVYFGATLPVPFGTGALTVMSASQTAESFGILVPDGKVANRYQFTLLVPADVTIDGDLLGTPLGTQTFPALLPLTGEVDVLEDGIVSIRIDGENSFDETTPIDPPIALEDLPFDLPTIIPPGNFAHVLLNGDISSVSVAQNISLHLEALGMKSTSFDPADLNEDGVVDAQDLLILLVNWGPCPGKGECIGDIVGDDDNVGVEDLLALLFAWS